MIEVTEQPQPGRAVTSEGRSPPSAVVIIPEVEMPATFEVIPASTLLASATG